MSSFISKPFRALTNAVGGLFSDKDLSSSITKNTYDQWLPGQTKDTAEMISAVIAAPGLGSALAGSGGSIGAFFQSNVGQSIIKFAQQFGLGGLGGMMNGYGMGSGEQSFVEHMLMIAALAALGNQLAKDELNQAEELEAQEKTLVDGLVSKAQAFNDPRYIEQNTQKALEQVETEYRRAGQEVEHDLYSRGMGESMVGPTARLASDKAMARMATRRDVETQAPLDAMQATSIAMRPLQSLSERTRTRAENIRAMPTNLYQSWLGANRQSPADQYYQQQLQQMQAQQKAQQQATAWGALAGGLSGVGSAMSNTVSQGMPAATGLAATGQAGAQNAFSNQYNSMSPFQRGWTGLAQQAAYRRQPVKPALSFSGRF